jgi:thiol-disulfide isomerase/thioredoxin
MEGHLPGFDGATEWLNSEPLTVADLRGRVVVVDFWTYTCINWLRTLAYVRAWADTYREAGLVVVGVHTPEFPFERDVENVRRAVSEMNVSYPVALDPNYAVWGAFANHYWPALYIADAEGQIRYHHFGEGAYEESERAIQELLREAGAEVSDELVSVSPAGLEAQADWEHLGTPETYLGYDRAGGEGGWSLSGEWATESRACVLREAGGSVSYRYHARDVNLVLRSREGTPIPFRVEVDGNAPGAAHGLDVDGDGNGTLVEPRLCQLVREPGRISDRTVEITFGAPGAEAYVFTFG